MSARSHTVEQPSADARRFDISEPSGNLRRRLLVSRFFEASQTASALLAVAVLGIVVYSVASRGASVLSLDFLTKSPPVLEENPGGGIAPEIIGTALMMAMATAIAAPIGIATALYLSEFATTRPARVIKLTLDLLNGLPSIIVGLFIFGLLVVGHHQSGFAGALALSIIMLPMIARAGYEVLLLVPSTWREGADALGVSRWRTVLGVVLPGATGGMITATVLAAARAAGETAPLLFTTSIVANGIVLNMFGEALPSIPAYIFKSSEAANRYGEARAWGAALVLLSFILLASVGARTLLGRNRSKLAL
jgi:phosphate transport system permease protein